MRKKTTSTVALVLAALAVPAVSAMTAEEVIAKHVAARGGKEAWGKIETLRLTGDFTAFSLVEPFTLLRKRDNHYSFDHVQNGHKVLVAYDGREAWWDNGWFGGGARNVEGPDLAVVMRDVDFATPFFDYEQRGWKVNLIGETEIEGSPSIGLELIRDDGQKETWHLDPKTYLEIARLSPGSDFGSPMPQRTFYDDFRKVGDVTLPHLVETQWYTRNTTMKVTQVEMNVALDDTAFAMPAPPGMAVLLKMVGDWKVAARTRQQPGAPWQDSESTSKIEKQLRGAAIEESTTTSGGSLVRTLSYDKFQEKYRLTSINDFTTHMDVEDGTFDDTGRLVLSNVATGTKWNAFGMTFHNRTTFSEIGDDGFKVEQEISVDGGANWFVAYEGTYSRPAPAGGANNGGQ